jgi:hypothetical protein
MARIKIKDLPKDRKITKEEMKRIHGGISSEPVYFQPGIISAIYFQQKISSEPLYMKIW